MNFAVYFEQSRSNAVKFSKSTLPKWAYYFKNIPKSEIDITIEGRGERFTIFAIFRTVTMKLQINLENENLGIDRQQHGRPSFYQGSAGFYRSKCSKFELYIFGGSNGCADEQDS